MSFYYNSYVTVAERRKQANKKMRSLIKKGLVVEPVKIVHRGKIAGSFWGRAWCEHLESYSDYANRLPRGRTYVRNGSVVHLSIESGWIKAFVSGSSLYEIEIRIDPLPTEKWEALKALCQGKIGSLIELLQGKISDEIMAIVTDRKTGLFPGPKEIHTNCNCPDWADLCKHLAAVLYGVGARLDTAPELLFKLRGVDHTELITTSTRGLAAPKTQPGSGRRRLDSSVLEDVFGIELEPTNSVADTESPRAKRRPASSKSPRKRAPAKKTTSPVRNRSRSKTATPTPDNAVKRVKRQGTAAKKTPFRPTAALVRRLRDHLGMNRSVFASVLGVSSTTIANWESAKGTLKLQRANHSALRTLYSRNRPS